MSKIHILIVILTSVVNITYAQSDTIRLKNPSFEDTPKRGGESSQNISGWFDCGKISFPAESPPDIHPNGFWNVNLEPNDGKTYLGMVVRDNATYEVLSGVLDQTLKAKKTYKMSVYLAQSQNYLSHSRTTHKKENYNTPSVFWIWGGDEYCNEKQLLYESPPIDHDNWRKYEITFKPDNDINAITISAYFTPNTDLAYNGNILIDNISEIILVK